MLSRLAYAQTAFSPMFKNALQQVPIRQTMFRQFNREARPRSGVSRSQVFRENPTLKERLMAPPGANAYAIGKGAMAGGAVLGIGALCYYGAGLGDGTNTLENSHLWPEYVKQRVKDTYFYFGSSIAISAASAAAVFRSPALMNLVGRGGFVAIALSMAAMIGTGMVARSIPYAPGLGSKQLAWAAHAAVLGAFIAPVCFLGGPMVIRAALYTAGIVSGLSTVAVCAPSDKFLYMGGPLAIGLGFVFASSMASMFLPATTALGAGIYSISLYGGLLLFSAFLLYDTQKIMRQAEMYPVYAERPFDPVNASIGIYLDTINIFIRIISILSGSSRRK